MNGAMIYTAYRVLRMELEGCSVRGEHWDWGWLRCMYWYRGSISWYYFLFRSFHHSAISVLSQIFIKNLLLMLVNLIMIFRSAASAVVWMGIYVTEHICSYFKIFSSCYFFGRYYYLKMQDVYYFFFVFSHFDLCADLCCVLLFSHRRIRFADGMLEPG